MARDDTAGWQASRRECKYRAPMGSPDMADAPSGWLGRQGWRARVAVRDGRRLVSLLLRTLRTAVAVPEPSPSLAFLAGPETVRAGAPAVYVVRVCNPTAVAAHLQLVAQGSCSTPRGLGFRIERSIDVPAGDVITYRLCTAWDGRASIDAGAGDDGDPPEDGDPQPADAAACDVHVRLVHQAAAIDHLHVRAALLG
jgi:hypothetical protein